MANGHGGARPGAGRKPKNQVHADVIETAEGQIAGKLVKVVTNIEKLANGGYKRTKTVWKPAGLVQVVRTEEVSTDSGPKILRFLDPAFPKIEDPKTLVCISKTEEWAEPNLAANIYLADRIMGKTAPLGESNDLPPSELPEDLETGISKVWEVKDEADEMFDFEEELPEIEPEESIVEALTEAAPSVSQTVPEPTPISTSGAISF